MQPVRVLITVPDLEGESDIIKQIEAVSDRVNVLFKPCKTNIETANILKDVEVLYTQTPPNHLDYANCLRWVQLCFTGVDNKVENPMFDPHRKITVTNGAGAHAVAIAEYCMAAMGILTRNLLQFFRDQQSTIRDRSHSPVLDLHCKTLCIVGYGQIGREVARLASAYHMRIMAVDPNPDWRTSSGFQWPGVGDPQGNFPKEFFTPGQLHQALEQSDYVVCCAPLTPKTKNLFSHQEFGAMKSGAYFIHVGRGPTLDDMALAKALENGSIAGAAVDVFASDPDPLPPDHPMWTLDNAYISPHVSGNRNRAYFQKMNDILCENLRRYLQGESLFNVVTRQRGY